MTTFTVLTSLLVGLCVGIVYGVLFMQQQTHMLATSAPQPSGWRTLGTTIRRYAILLILFGALMYTQSFAIWWVLAGFFLAFWVQVIRSLRAVR